MHSNKKLSNFVPSHELDLQLKYCAISLKKQDAPCDVQDRWQLESVKFEAVVSFPFSHGYSLIVSPRFIKHHSLVPLCLEHKNHLPEGFTKASIGNSGERAERDW